MNQRERNELDRHITGNFGEDGVTDEQEHPSEAAMDAAYGDLGLSPEDMVTADLELEQERIDYRVAQDDARNTPADLEPFLPEDDE